MRPRSVARPRRSTSAFGRVPIVQITVAVPSVTPSASVTASALIALACAPMRTSTPRLISDRCAARPSRSDNSSSSRG
jgi:hypothetical protein